MNAEHDAFCSSPEWAARLAEEVIPWGLADVPLTGHVLELGAGFGASTACLMTMTSNLTLLEADPLLVAGLRDRFPALDVRHGDATIIALPDSSIDTVVCFTMLHHVSPAAAQDRLFSEVARVLRPAGWFAGTDSLASDNLRDFHQGDIYEPLDPQTLKQRLLAAGFRDATVDHADRRLRWRARTR